MKHVGDVNGHHARVVLECVYGALACGEAAGPPHGTRGHSPTAGICDGRSQRAQLARPSRTRGLHDDGCRGRQSWSMIRWRPCVRTCVPCSAARAILTVEPGGALNMALRAAQRAFDEIDARNTLLDTQRSVVMPLGRGFEGCLAEGNSAVAPCLLDEHIALAARVAASAMERQDVLRILGTEEFRDRGRPTGGHATVPGSRRLASRGSPRARRKVRLRPIGRNDGRAGKDRSAARHRPRPPLSRRHGTRDGERQAPAGLLAI